MIKKSLMLIGLAALLVPAAPLSAQASSQEKAYVLNLYHFNIQYVVGSKASMRRIVKQSFEPLVDFFLDHPGWGADFEMQGLMIKYMADNYPEVLSKFKKLVNSGQAELVTFHYADQLLLAFPAHDQEWSLRLNQELLREHGIERSRVIFAQEAQFGEGMAYLGVDHGYDVAIMTTSEYKWFQDDQRFPYFTVNGMDLITNKDAELPEAGIKVEWHFLGDGELVATGGLSPYFPGLFRKNPIKLMMLERKFEDYEDKGYKIAKISEYVEALRGAGVKPQSLRPILDCPWRPEDGSGVFQWMGKYSTRWEKDYDIRTRNWQTRNLLVEAERAGPDKETLERAWSHMINAEVTDPTGWYPLPVEINWDYEQMEAAEKALESAPNLDMEALRDKARQRPECGDRVREPPVEVRLFGNAGGAEVVWQELPSYSGSYCMEVSWTGKGDGGAALPFNSRVVEYSPAMMEHTTREIALDDIKAKTIHLGLPNGLVRLDENTWLVRDNASGCVAAGLYFKDREVKFEIKNGKEEHYAFRFYILKDVPSNEALGFANKLNRINP